MRIITIVIPAILSLNWFGLFWSGWLFVVLLTLFFIGRALRAAYLEKKLWGSRWENIYLVDESIKIDFEINYPQLFPLCFFIQEGEMVRAMKEATDNLKRAGNRFMLPGNEYNAQTWQAIKIQILPIWPRSGEWVNETSQEYATRAASYIMQDRQIRHQNLKALAPEWYQYHHHKEQA